MTTKTEASTFPELYDWQKEHASNLITSLTLNGFAKDGSDTGTGKTYVALHAAKVLGLEPFVICPKAVVPSWKESAKAFGFTDPYVFTYELMRRGNTEYYREGKWRLRPSGVLMIFDEDHRCKGSKSENAKMLIQAKKQKLKILCLGATSCTNPIEMRALGYVLDMHQDSDWYRWALKNGCKRGVFGGLTFNNAKTVLDRLHSHIYKEGRGSRIKLNMLPLGTFPRNLIMADGYDLAAKDEISGIYDDLKDQLIELDGKRNEDGENPLTVQLRARQEVEVLKVPLFEDLARDAFANNNSVVIFVNFRTTAELLLKRLAGLCEIRTIHGGQTETERELQCLGFQNDVARIMICTIQAGGTGLNLHDTKGSFPRVSLISPTFSAIDFKQCLGRIHRAGAKTPVIQKIIFANDTVEMRVCQLVRKKLNNIDLINDGELNPVL